MKRAWLFIVCGYIIALMAFHLADFPGLHFDEAWFGLKALRIQSEGLTSAHGMNTHSGSLFPWLLSQVFWVAPPGVLALRLPGVLLNTAALAILLTVIESRAGRQSAVLLFLLFGSSLAYLWQSRIAWEVTALHLFLLAVSLAIVVDAGARGRWTAPGIVLFVLAAEIGAANHLLYTVVPVSFLAASLVAGAGRTDARATESAWIGTLTVASMCLLLLMKWAISDPLFVRWHLLIVVLLLAWPLLILRWSRARPLAFREWVQRCRPWWWLVPLLLGVAAFAIVHGIALVGVLANLLVMKRFGWVPALPWTLLGYLWGLALVGIFVVIARATIQRVRLAEPLNTADLVTLWTLACFGALVVVLPRQSLRYYVLPCALLSISIALSLPKYRGIARRFGLAAALVFLGVNVVAWRGIMEGTGRPPLDFRIGPAREVSKHFLPLDLVDHELAARGACLIKAPPSIDLPLAFYRVTRPRACRADQVYRVRYCKACPPTYFSLEPDEGP